MKKMCPGCGAIFEAEEGQRFCSDRCKKDFAQPLIAYIKR
jgi:predicted nucleic acid-binding Zn ribbon protein